MVRGCPSCTCEGGVWGRWMVWLGGGARGHVLPQLSERADPLSSVLGPDRRLVQVIGEFPVDQSQGLGAHHGPYFGGGGTWPGGWGGGAAHHIADAVEGLLVQAHVCILGFGPVQGKAVGVDEGCSLGVYKLP